MDRRTVPYGLWPSPISPISLSQGKALRAAAAWDDDGETLVWLEGRADRGVLVVADADCQAPRDLTTALSVRARVGYGGGDFTVARGNAYFVAEGRIYRQPLRAGSARPITPAFADAASPAVSPDGRWLLYVYSYERRDGLALVDTEGSLWPQKLVSGDDFYMQPVWHPGGQRIAWVSWDHPQMPWDGTRLNLATLRPDAAGMPAVAEQAVIAGGQETSIFQPAFSPDGRYLAYVSDVSGWYNLYLYDLESGQHRPLVEEEAELGLAAWAQGTRTIAWLPDSSAIVYCRSEQGFSRLWRVDVATGERSPVSELDSYTEVSQPAVSSRGKVAVLASAWNIPTRLVTLSPAMDATRVMARAEGETVPASAFSKPEPIQWTSGDGTPVYGLYYAPHSDEYVSAGKPPLIVMVHGGPTSQSTAGYSARAQFFTTRGYAVLEPNYRGSSGYGRAYRDALREQWGIYDVEDSLGGARYLAEQGLVDRDKMVIMGGSAGGFTVLLALIQHPGVFKAGICMYGVTNLFTLAADTHKFEERYMDSMIGPLPETAERYRERSPIFAVDRIRDPIAVFQGEDDRVVPKEQAETVVKVLRQHGVPHEYHLYPGEGHGWRKSETIQSFYESVLSFLKQNVLFA
ncbi:MAG: S9 family peptidase [Chloroflexi bacterium]|nr:S9 family peptidase [Chloroflexota bacterium]